MGPRRRCRGRRARTDAPERLDCSLQWGHDEGVVEDDRMAGWRPSPRRCFNGATTKVSWKTRQALMRRLRQDTQLQWGHDEGVVEDVAWRTRLASAARRFNGATTKCRGRRARCIAIGQSVVLASMGPRRRCRGRRRPRIPHTRIVQSLQWGHDEGSWKTRHCARSRSPSFACFNGATTSVVEELRTSQSSVRVTIASMGPRRRVVEDGDDGPGCPQSAVASMGPRRRCRGRRMEPGPATASWTCFNGATTKCRGRPGVTVAVDHGA